MDVSALTGSTVIAGHSGYGVAMAVPDRFTRHLSAEYSDFGERADAVAPDRFPERVPVEQVVRAIVEPDSGEMTGRVSGGRRAGGSMSRRGGVPAGTWFWQCDDRPMRHHVSTSPLRRVGAGGHGRLLHTHRACDRGW